jgi:hypothetical protein
VVNVSNLNGYKSSFIAKADGVNIYIFCYEFGYMIYITDPESTVISPRVSTTYKDLSKIQKKRPDVLLAEMMNGFLVYIDVLAVNGDEKLSRIIDRY